MDTDRRNIILGSCAEDPKESVAKIMKDVIAAIDNGVKLLVIARVHFDEALGSVTIAIKPEAQQSEIDELLRIVELLADHYRISFSRGDGRDGGHGNVPANIKTGPRPNPPSLVEAEGIDHSGLIVAASSKR